MDSFVLDPKPDLPPSHVEVRTPGGNPAFILTLLVAFAAVVMHLHWAHSLFALAVLLIAFALAAVALGTMLGTFLKTESQANGLSIMLGMSMALLGGCWYPLELFPEAARTVVRVLPTTGAMQGLTDLSMRGAGLMDILPEAGVLLGFAAVFFAIGVWRFRYEYMPTCRSGRWEILGVFRRLVAPPRDLSAPLA